MSDTPKNLFPLVPPSDKVFNHDMVELLQSLLDKAKAGNIDSVVILTREDGATFDRYVSGMDCLQDYLDHIGLFELAKQSFIRILHDHGVQ